MLNINYNNIINNINKLDRGGIVTNINNNNIMRRPRLLLLQFIY